MQTTDRLNRSHDTGGRYPAYHFGRTWRNRNNGELTLADVKDFFPIGQEVMSSLPASREPFRGTGTVYGHGKWGQFDTLLLFYSKVCGTPGYSKSSIGYTKILAKNAKRA